MSDPSYCAERIPFHDDLVLLTGKGGVAAIYDGVKITVHYTSYTDLAGVLAEGKTWDQPIKVSLHGVESQSTISITMLNPCLDSNYFDITCGSATPEAEYFVGLQGTTWTHNEFNIIAEPHIKQLCGGLRYTGSLGSLENNA